MNFMAFPFKFIFLGCLGGSAVERLPLAQVMIPGSRIESHNQAPHREPTYPSACVSASLSEGENESLMNK